MTDHSSNYRLAEARQSERLSQFEQSTSFASLKGESALARSLIEERLNSASTTAERAAAMPLVRDLLATLASLVKAQHAHQIVTGELLDKAAIRQFAGEVVAIIIEELSEVQDWESIADRIGTRL